MMLLKFAAISSLVSSVSAMRCYNGMSVVGYGNDTLLHKMSDIAPSTDINGTETCSCVSQSLFNANSLVAKALVCNPQTKVQCDLEKKEVNVKKPLNDGTNYVLSTDAVVCCETDLCNRPNSTIEVNGEVIDMVGNNHKLKTDTISPSFATPGANAVATLVMLGSFMAIAF